MHDKASRKKLRTKSEQNPNGVKLSPKPKLKSSSLSEAKQVVKKVDIRQGDKRPVIKIAEIVSGPVNNCVYVPWYQFRHCNVTSCKNHSASVRHGCLAVGRKIPEGTKVISDEEIRLYKFPKRKVSTRLTSMKRKDATDRVRAVLVLREYLKYIREEFYVSGVQPHFTHPSLLKRENRKPLNLKYLGFENWMWEHVLDETTFRSFQRRKGGGECATIELREVLQFDEGKWALFKKKLSGIFFN